MTLFLSYLINGISLGSVYAIIALGYTMVYGIAKMLNFAHGDVIMVGAYICFCASQYMGLPAIVSILMAMVVCTALGVVIEGLAYKPLRQAPSLAVLITAIGVSYFLQNIALSWKTTGVLVITADISVLLPTAYAVRMPMSRRSISLICSRRLKTSILASGRIWRSN